MLWFFTTRIQLEYYSYTPNTHIQLPELAHTVLTNKITVEPSCEELFLRQISAGQSDSQIPAVMYFYSLKPHFCYSVKKYFLWSQPLKGELKQKEHQKSYWWNGIKQIQKIPKKRKQKTTTTSQFFTWILILFVFIKIDIWKLWKQLWVLTFCVQQLVSVVHGTDFRNKAGMCGKEIKYQTNHWPTLFCSSAVQSKPTWLCHEDPKFETKIQILQVCKYWQKNKMKSADEVFVRCPSFQVNLCLGFRFPLRWKSYKTKWFRNPFH